MRYKVNRDEFDIYPETWLQLDNRGAVAVVSGFTLKATKQPQDACKMLHLSRLKCHLDRDRMCFSQISCQGSFFFSFFLNTHVPCSSAHLRSGSHLPKYAYYVRQQGVLPAYSSHAIFFISSRSNQSHQACPAGWICGRLLKSHSNDSEIWTVTIKLSLVFHFQENVQKCEWVFTQQYAWVIKWSSISDSLVAFFVLNLDSSRICCC